MFKLGIMALALMLIFEGLMPFLMPQMWRDTMHRLLQCKDGQLRFIGAFTLVAGLLLYFLANIFA